MDNIREKLVGQLRELADRTPPICQYQIPEEIEIFGKKVTVYCKPFEQFQELLREAADYISNNVTVLPVQVGDTVYGRFPSYGKEVHQCKVVKVKACQFKDRTVRYFLDLEFDTIDPFFRDGRLIRCGMQAIYGADFGDWYRVYLTREEAEAAPPKGE